MNFDLKAQGNKSTRDRTLMKLPKSPGLMVSALIFQKQAFYHLILMNYVLGWNFYYQKNTLEIILI